MDPRAREIEEAVVDAWPARELEDVEGWLMQHSGGPTHRANSVSALEARGGASLDERIARMEAWYAQRGARASVQVGPCTVPAGLDAALESRGYAKVGEAVAAVAEPRALLARLPRRLEASVAMAPSDAWLAVAERASRFAEHAEVLRGFLSRLGTRCRFASARDASGRVIGTALGVSCEARPGVYQMLTLPEARRRGAGSALLRALTEGALADGVEELYLLVEPDNTAARSLYARAGFVDLYRYHYRERA